MIQYRILNTDDKPKEIFRVLESNYEIDEKNLETPKEQDIKFSGHWGQRKLLMAEIEFLSIVSKFISLDKKDALIVYIGAANGVRDNIYKAMFPNTQWILYDPLEFAIKPCEQFIIKTGKDGFFTNEKIKDVLKLANGRKIVYVNDIRTELDEKSIWENMQQQQRWGIEMHADFMMLKFRLPYLSLKDGQLSIADIVKLDYDLSSIKNDIIIKNGENNNLSVLYLNGKIHTQLHAPKRSSETRLITGKLKYFGDTDNGEMYSMKYYDIDKYDKQMSYFNKVDRHNIYYYKKSQDAINHIIGYDNSYDVTGEYVICYRYLKYYKKEKYNHDLIIKLMNFINLFMHKITHVTTLVTYVLDSYGERIESLNKNNERELAKKVYRKMEILSEKIKYSFDKQMKLMMSSKILNDNEKMSQKELYKKISYEVIGTNWRVIFKNGKLIISKHR